MVLKVRTRLMILYGVFTAVILCQILFTIGSFLFIQQHIYRFYNQKYIAMDYLYKSEQNISITNQSAFSLLVAKRENSTGNVNAHTGNISVNRKEVLNNFEKFAEGAALTDEESTTLIKDFRDSYTVWNNAYSEFLSLIAASADNYSSAEKMVASGIIRQSTQSLQRVFDILALTVSSSMRKEITSLNTNITILISILGGLITLIILFGIGQFRFFKNSIFSHVEEITQRLYQIANEDGDLTLELAVKKEDEFGLLSQNFNNFVSHIRESIGIVKSASQSNVSIKEKLILGNKAVSSSVAEIDEDLENIRSIVSGLNQSVDQTESGIKYVQSVVENLDKKIDQETGMVEDSTSSVTEMIASITSITEIAEKQKTAADLLLSKGHEGQEKLNSSIEAVDSIGKSIHMIRDMTTLISSVASQTNLLAMNAAIEAAHAGDAGRGFAVVADEIRKLAESASTQSKEITRTLKDVLKRITNADTANEESRKSFSEIFSQIKTVVEAFSEITSNMEELRQGGNHIHQAMAELQDAAQETRSSGNDIRVEAGKISDQVVSVTSASNNVSRAIENINREIKGIHKETGVVTALSEDLDKTTNLLVQRISMFKTDTNESE